MAFFFWYGIRDRARTHLNAIVQWTVAATSANTGSNTYFCPSGQKCKSSPISSTKEKVIPTGMAFSFASVQASVENQKI
jgi:hypothetical protein